MLYRLIRGSQYQLNRLNTAQPRQHKPVFRRWFTQNALQTIPLEHLPQLAATYQYVGPDNGYPDHAASKEETQTWQTKAGNEPVALDAAKQSKTLRRRPFRRVRGPQKPSQLSLTAPHKWRLYKPWSTEQAALRRNEMFGKSGSLPEVEHEPSYLEWPRLSSLGTWARGVNEQRDSQNLQNSQNDASHCIDLFSFDWSKRFAMLENGKRIDTWGTKHVDRIVRRYAGSGAGTSMQILQKTWLLRNSIERWQDLMLWSLQNSPKRALIILDATLSCKSWKPPRYMVQDSLQFLARHFLYAVTKVDTFAINAIWDMTIKFIQKPHQDGRVYAMSQEVVQLLLKYCPNDRVVLMYQQLIENQADLQTNTLLHFLERFVHLGKLGLSMDLLRQIIDMQGYYGEVNTDTFFSKDKMQSACVKILRTQWNSEGLYPIQSRILTEMLEMGIRPNTHMCNVILLNMVEGGDFDTAWQTYDLARESRSFVKDSITYDILLKGARISGNVGVFDNVLGDLREDPEMLRDLHLFGTLLHTVASFSPGHEYPAMFDVYRRHLDLRPLYDLGLCKLDAMEIPEASIADRWPDSYILGQMILAYNKRPQSSDELIDRYTRYRGLVEEGHPLIRPLAGDDYVANSFLLAFSKKSETLHYCNVVLQDMYSLIAGSPESTFAEPTVRTWSILLGGYTLHRQNYAAEKVLSIMQSRGLEPDIVTWNTLLGGYTAVQDVDGALGVMKRIEHRGLKPDSYTLKGLSRLWDKERLLGLLRSGFE